METTPPPPHEIIRFNLANEYSGIESLLFFSILIIPIIQDDSNIFNRGGPGGPTGPPPNMDIILNPDGGDIYLSHWQWSSNGIQKF